VKLPELGQTSLRTRFIMGMGVMLLPLMVLAGGAFLYFEHVIRVFDQVVQEASQEIAGVVQIQLLVRRVKIVLHDYFIPGFGDLRERQRFIEVSQEVDKAFQDIGARAFDLPQERDLIRSAQEEWQLGRRIGEVLLTTASPAKSVIAARQVERFDAHLDRATDLLQQLHALAHWEMDQHLAEVHTIRRRAVFVTGMVFVVGLGAAFLVGTALARSILLPLRALEEAADRFGAGDLSRRVSLRTQDELAQLGGTFNTMAEKLAKTQAALEDLSVHDGLTGLFNYREFHRRLREEAERAWRYGRPFSLLMIDIDYFKAVNDTFGHLAGDEALQALAALIRREVRPVDQVVRYGGEEFAIILPETPGGGAVITAERVRDVIAARPIVLASGQPVNLTISIGVATYPEDADSEEKLIGAADQALYDAKHAGRNQVRRADKS
jgi:two-component system, cell cycle response regulator